MLRAFASFVALLLTVAPAAAGQWYIPAAAHSLGAEGSVWRTDLVVHSYASATTTVTLTLLPQGADNSARDRTWQVTVAPGATLRIEDVLATAFAFDGTAALVVDADVDAVVVTSRTFNLVAAGSFGQFIPAAAAATAVLPGTEAILPGLGAGGGRRTNLGWVSLGDQPSEVAVALYSEHGELLASETFTEQPFGQTQFNLFTELGVAATDTVWARVRATVPVMPYASVVASISNDPIYVAARTSLDAATDLIFPAAAHVAGAGGTNWASDAWVVNLGSAPATLSLELWRQGQANPTPQTVTLDGVLAPLAQRALPDLILAQFGLDAAQGAVVVRSNQLVVATSRTYNTAPSGTFGQFIPAQRASSLGGVGETLLLPGAIDGSGFRTNLGLVATASGSRVELVLRGGDGAVLESVERALGAGEQLQLRASTAFGVASFPVATVEVRLAAADDPNGRVAAYLSIVDEGTTDPTFAGAARTSAAAPDLDATTQALMATTYVLSTVVDSAGPNARAPKTPACVTAEYSRNEVGVGQSPEGKCWAADITLDGCSWDFPRVGWGVTADGTVSSDVCAVSGYPSTVDVRATSDVRDLATGSATSFATAALLQVILRYDGLRPESGQLIGEVELTTASGRVEAFVDLFWDDALTGLELFPTGTIQMEVPYSAQVAVAFTAAAAFDGSEWVLVEVRAGAWHTAFYLNLVTGEVTPV